MWQRIRLILILAGLLLPGAAIAGAAERPGAPDRGEVPFGTLIIPGAAEQRDQGQAEKKCMKVCIRWSEDCIIDGRGVRQCRRSCQEFGEQCF